MVNIINLAMAACPCHVWAHKDTHKQQATAYLWTPTQKTKTMRGCGTRGHELVVDVVVLGWCLGSVSFRVFPNLTNLHDSTT